MVSRTLVIGITLATLLGGGVAIYSALPSDVEVILVMNNPLKKSSLTINKFYTQKWGFSSQLRII